MELTIFILTAVVAVISALVVITRKNPVTSVLFLVVTFFCVAVLYVLLGAQFIAAMQVIVYAGAIMVLFIFVLMLLNLREKQKWEVITPLRVTFGFISAGGILIALSVLLKSGSGGAALNPAMGTVAAVGDALFTRFLYPFEVASVLLLAAIIGVVAMVKRNDVPEKGGDAS